MKRFKTNMDCKSATPGGVAGVMPQTLAFISQRCVVGTMYDIIRGFPNLLEMDQCNKSGNDERKTSVGRSVRTH